jgi:hypothetical protein
VRPEGEGVSGLCSLKQSEGQAQMPALQTPGGRQSKHESVLERVPCRALGPVHNTK